MVRWEVDIVGALWKLGDPPVCCIEIKFFYGWLIELCVMLLVHISFWTIHQSISICATSNSLSIKMSDVMQTIVDKTKILHKGVILKSIPPPKRFVRKSISPSLYHPGTFLCTALRSIPHRSVQAERKCTEKDSSTEQSTTSILTWFGHIFTQSSISVIIAEIGSSVEHSVFARSTTQLTQPMNQSLFQRANHRCWHEACSLFLGFRFPHGTLDFGIKGSHTDLLSSLLADQYGKIDHVHLLTIRLLERIVACHANPA